MGAGFSSRVHACDTSDCIEGAGSHMITIKEMIQLFMAACGSMGFAIIFRIRKDSLFPAAIGGFGAWFFYLLVSKARGDYMAASLAGAIFCSLWSEFWARRKKQPATVFLIASVIPLIPGNALYQTMNSLVSGQFHEAWRWGLVTILTMVFIAIGTSLVSALFILKDRVRE